MNVKVSLEPTSALVVDLAGKFYDEDPLTREYMRHLDLSSGQRMIDHYKESGIYDLTRELVHNRKFFIRETILKEVRAQHSSPGAQVVILAAGKPPLSIELLSREREKIGKIYEIGLGSFNEKISLYQKIAPHCLEKVAFLNTDVRSSQLPEELEKAGFNASLFTVVVIEGITHYMSKNDLGTIFEMFASLDHRTHCAIIEFGQPYEDMTARIQPIAREAFRIIEDDCYMQPMTKHRPGELAKALEAAGGKMEGHYTTNDIERMRTGKNAFFPEKNSGWLEYMVARI
jgi:hypothetical protein